jgi:hypothetical protein
VQRYKKDLSLQIEIHTFFIPFNYF